MEKIKICEVGKYLVSTTLIFIILTLFSISTYAENQKALFLLLRSKDIQHEDKLTPAVQGILEEYKYTNISKDDAIKVFKEKKLGNPSVLFKTDGAIPLGEGISAEIVITASMIKSDNKFMISCYVFSIKDKTQLASTNITGSTDDEILPQLKKFILETKPFIKETKTVVKPETKKEVVSEKKETKVQPKPEIKEDKTISEEVKKEETPAEVVEEKKPSSDEDYVISSISQDMDIVLKIAALGFGKFNTSKKFDHPSVQDEIESGFGAGFEADILILRMINKSLLFGISTQYAFDGARASVPLVQNGIAYGSATYDSSRSIIAGPMLLLSLNRMLGMNILSDFSVGTRILFGNNVTTMSFVYANTTTSQYEYKKQNVGGISTLFTLFGQLGIFNFGNAMIITRVEAELQLGSNDRLSNTGANIALKAGVSF